MLGAVAGDIIGSVYEFTGQKRYDLKIQHYIMARFQYDLMRTVDEYARAINGMYRVKGPCRSQSSAFLKERTSRTLQDSLFRSVAMQIRWHVSPAQ